MECTYCGKPSTNEWHTKCRSKLEKRKRDGLCVRCGVNAYQWKEVPLCYNCDKHNLPFSGYGI